MPSISRGQLQRGGIRAVLQFGSGFLRHPANDRLRQRLEDDAVAAESYLAQLSYLVFRLLFLQRARERGACSPVSHPGEQGAGAEGEPRSENLAQVFRDLASKGPLSGFLWSPAAMPDLDDCRLSNADLEIAVTCLADEKEPLDLGALYQALLQLHPEVDVRKRTFDLVRVNGHRRKTSGSYYTPAALVDGLLTSALEPVLEEAANSATPESALLSLRVCDPECGSGHFLVAAGRRIAARLTSLRTGIPFLQEITTRGASGPPTQKAALREVVRHCLYGVDRDPLAVELCKIALWLECDDPGQTPSFLDGHIRCGNSLVGATPALAAGQDSDAWTASCLEPMPCSPQSLRTRHGFFHWQQEFPDVFALPECGQGPKNSRAGWDGGFDVVLGNPPWERVKLQEREWFAARFPAVAEAPDAAARKRLVVSLKSTQPRLHVAFRAEADRAVAEARFLLHSGRYPLSGRGDINAYGPFVETARLILKPGGRAGLVVPSGIATDDTLKTLFRDLLEQGHLVSLFDFHNRGPLFPDVQGNVKFCLLTLSGQPCQEFLAAAQLDHPDQLSEPGRTYSLSAPQVARLNPNTLHCPTFASARDADLVGRIHDRFGVLVSEGQTPSNRWGVRPWSMFHLTSDASHFRSIESLRAGHWRLAGNRFERDGRCCLPLYEAKLVHAFEHRAATFAGIDPGVRFRMHARARPTNVEERANPAFVVLPRYWVPEAVVDARAPNARWFLGFRNAISAVADARSLVAAILPRVGVGNSMPLLAGLDARTACLLLGLLNSLVLDYVLRQKASGGNLNFHVLKQLPVPPPTTFASRCPWSPGEVLADWFVERVLELSYRSWDLRDFARECGFDRPPFAPDEERYRLLRAELDAACFVLYGLARSEIEYVLSTFTIVERRETRAHGRALSREAVLLCHDRFTGGMGR